MCLPPNWALLGGPPCRQPPIVSDWACSVRDTPVPCLGWGPAAWPTDMDGVSHYFVAPPHPSARHGDFVHLQQVLLLHPFLRWSRNSYDGGSWMGLLPTQLLLLDGPDAGRILTPPDGTHITVATWPSLSDDQVLRIHAARAQSALTSAPRRSPPHLCTTCRLPLEWHLRPRRGSPDLVECYDRSELANVVQRIRRFMGFRSRGLFLHMRFGLRASQQESPAHTWRRGPLFQSVD